MGNDEESRRFEEIVAELRDENLGVEHRPSRRRGLFLAGIICILAAVAIFILGGVKGAVIAIVPWIVGMLLVVAGRPRA